MDTYDARGLFSREIALKILKRQLVETLGGYAPRSRQDYADALVHISDYLRIAGLPDRITVELWQLVRALGELNHGIVRPFLCPGKAFNKHVDPGDTWHPRALIAIAVQCLIDTGVSRRAAATTIAKNFPQLGPVLSPGSTDSTDHLRDVIVDWHKRISGKKVSSIEAQIVWDGRDKLIQQVWRGLEQKIGCRPDAHALAEEIAREAHAHGLKQATPADIQKAHDRNKSGIA